MDNEKGRFQKSESDNSKKSLRPSDADGHRKRMRARFKSDDGESMENYRLLEMLLYYTNARRDTRDEAIRLIREFGSLEDVFSAGFNEIKRVEGVGEQTALLLKLVAAVYRRIGTEKIPLGITCLSDDEIGNLFVNELRYLEKEHLSVAVLDKKSRLKGIKIIGSGAKCSVEASMEEILDYMNENDSSSIIIGHNHPEGFASLSFEDISSADFLSRYLGKINKKLIASVVTCKDRYAIYRIDEKD